MINFRAQLEPEQMLIRGVFGGSYFRAAKKQDLLQLRPSIVELAVLNQNEYTKSKNEYKVRAGQTYEVWARNDWIFPEDPLGWFHWYCRYCSGRRHGRDTHQIARYNNYVTRWGAAARNQLRTKGIVSAVVKQGLLQWAIDPDNLF